MMSLLYKKKWWLQIFCLKNFRWVIELLRAPDWEELLFFSMRQNSNLAAQSVKHRDLRSSMSFIINELIREGDLLA